MTPRALSAALSKYRYWIVSALLLILMLLNTIYGRWTGDFWEHSAVVREIAAHPFNPDHPLLAVDQPHPFYSPYLVAIGYFVRLLSLSPVTALAFAGMANLLLLLIGLRAFCQTLFEQNQHIISFYALILIVFSWPAAAWNWSGFFHFHVLGFVLPYPSTFTMALTFIIFWLYGLALHQARPSLMLLTAILTAVVLLTHPTTGVITLLGIGALSLSAMPERGKRALLAGAGVLAGSLILAFLWPYYWFYALLSYNDTEFHELSIILYLRPEALWPLLLLALPACAILYQRARRTWLDPLLLLLAGSLFIYGFGFISGQYGFGRIISFIAILIQTTAAAFFANWETNPARGKAWLAPLTFILFVTLIARNPANEAALMRIRLGAQGQRVSYAEYAQIGDIVGEDGVVLADLASGWQVPAYGGKLIASPHPAHWVEDHPQRRADIETFFTAETDTAVRQELLQKYAVDFILVNTNTIADPQPYRVLGELAATTDNFLLIAVENSIQ